MPDASGQKRRLFGRALKPASLLVGLVAWLLMTMPALAQTARLYINAPKETHLLITTFNGMRSNSLADPAIVDSEIESRFQTASLAYAYITSLNGRTGGFGFVVPSVSMLSFDKSSRQVLIDETGWGDVTLTFDYNLFGAPALTREELARHRPGNYAGLHFSLTTPTGSYEAARNVNIGGNRWALKTTLNYSITNDGGESWWDFYPSVRFFSDNNEFGGGSTLSQKPLFALEAHYSRNVTNGAWISAGLITAFGGETRSNGEISEESMQDLRLALGAGFRTWPRGAAFLAYNRNIADSGGSARISNFMLQLMHQF